MSSFERNIDFHFEVLQKVENLSDFIISKLQLGEPELAFDGIQNRDQLLKIIFKLVDSIEEQFSLLPEPSTSEVIIFEKWVLKVKNWAEEEALLNQKIERLLIREKEDTTKEIAAIFDKKSRHKGYDLSTMK